MRLKKRQCRLDRIKRKHRVEIFKMFLAVAGFMAAMLILEVFGK
jgi:hypothetical protein